MPSYDSGRSRMDVGQALCLSCGTVIYAWLDNCPHCGKSQEKEAMNLAHRLRRAGVCVSDELLQLPLETACEEWQHDGTLELLRARGLCRFGDLLNRSEVELNEMFPDEEISRRIWRFLPLPDTRPITEEAREWKLELLGAFSQIVIDRIQMWRKRFPAAPETLITQPSNGRNPEKRK